MKAKVSLVWKPCITVQVGGEETIDGNITFVAEEEYSFTKSGFTGYLNRVHEDGPGDCVYLDHVGWDKLIACLRSAFSDGAPNMTACERVQLLEVFKTLAPQNINHKFELVDNHCGGAICPGHGEEDGSLPWCPDAKMHSGYEEPEMALDEDDVKETADKDPVDQVEDCPKCGVVCICATIDRCNSIIRGDDHEG